MGPLPGRPEPGAEVPDTAIVVESGDETPEGRILAEAEQAWVGGDYVAAAELSDSLASAWTRRPDIRERPVRRLVRLLLARAEDVEAVDQLLYHPDALDESWRVEMRRATERMSIPELDDLSRRISRDDRALGIVRVEYARALALAGRTEDALDAARRLDGGDLYDPDRRKLEDVLEGRVAAATPRIRIGLIAPRTGGFAPVGDQLIEGARLAARHYEEETGVPVELVVVDEATEVDMLAAEVPLPAVPGDSMVAPDSAASADEQLAGLDTSGLAGVVGPVMSENLRFLSGRRAAPGLVLVSPTASEDSALVPHAYSLWDRARRDSLEATTLADWLISAFEPNRMDVIRPDTLVEPTLGPARVAALYPDNESGARRARLVREAVESAGFEWVGGQAYDPDQTTHEVEIQMLTESDPDFVYAIADGPRQVLQVAPQLHFYGLRGRITLVNQDWTHPVVLRRLDEPFSDYRVAAVYFERGDNPAWEAFAAAWDEEYRRSLPDNAFAALGYDAVTLIARSVADPALVRQAAVARALEGTRAFDGVTGTFSFDPATRRLTRGTRIRMILHSELVDPDPSAIADWSVEARELELQRLEQEKAEKEAEEARTSGD
jgi:ABC-type branched-subunit amino acid transport system substrate-binding protein